jgi:hypothetical protein
MYKMSDLGGMFFRLDMEIWEIDKGGIKRGGEKKVDGGGKGLGLLGFVVLVCVCVCVCVYFCCCPVECLCQGLQCT